MTSKKKTKAQRTKALRKAQMDRRHELESRIKKIESMHRGSFNEDTQALLNEVISSAEEELKSPLLTKYIS